MQIDWQVAVPMDDGVVLRCDVYRPEGSGSFPVILSYGPYAKGLAFQEGYAPQWEKMVSEHPDVAEGSTNKYQSWEVADPEKWVPHGYACVRFDSRGTGWSPGDVDVWSPREALDLARMHRVGRHPPVEQRAGGPVRDLLLRHEPVAGRRPRPAAPDGDDPVGGGGGLLPRRNSPRRDPL